MKVRALILIFEKRRTVPGNYYDCVVTAANNLSFEGVELHKNNNKNDPPIDPNIFYKQLKMSIEERLLSNDDSNFVNWTHTLDPKSWPENLALPFGEKVIRNLAKRLQLNERESIRGFRGYLNQKIFPENLVDLKNAFNAVSISSSECERGFSQMNLILTSTRTSLSTITVSALLFVRVVGPPLRHFSATKYVEWWILRGRHSAVDTNSKEIAGTWGTTKTWPKCGVSCNSFRFKFLCFVL
jgi:hypothetical protein